MLGDRVVPLREASHWPAQVESWLGSSIGHWEGDTLVIETANIHPGDNATQVVAERAASPINQQTQGAPPFNSIPISREARVTERLTLTGPDTITYELAYSDPEVFTAPWSARIDLAAERAIPAVRICLPRRQCADPQLHHRLAQAA